MNSPGEFYPIHSMCGSPPRDQSYAGCGMRVDMNQRLASALLLDGFYQIVSGLRLQQAGHILDANRVAPHIPQLSGHRGKRFHGVQRADGVRDCALCMLAGLLHHDRSWLPQGGQML